MAERNRNTASGGGQPDFSGVKTLLPRLALWAVLAVLSVSPLAMAQQPAAGTPPILPDPKLTPGDTFPVTLDDIKVKGYSATVRNVPVKEKRAVYAAYGITSWKRGEYEGSQRTEQRVDANAPG